MRLPIVITALSIFLLCSCGNEISGTIEKVEYIAQGTSFNAPDIKKTIIYFDDGRIKAFEGISNFTFYKGRYNIINYDGYHHITDVKTK